ncbi:purine-nucleoside phosphorylase [Rickettsiales bacterium LUAb2]
MTTPHINAKANDFAETVLLPGDPLRAKYVAENFLENITQVNSIRNVLGYTGTYKGKKVSVMATGMGIPSCSIYATELIKFYGVKNLIRIGTAGAYPDSGSNLSDVIIASGACTDSRVNRLRFNDFDFAAIANFDLVNAAFNTAKQTNVAVKIGNCFTSDYFYTPKQLNMKEILNNMGVLCVEMEAAGLYGVAFEHKAKALAILTISDIIGGSEDQILTAEQRQTGLNKMITLALDTAISL